MELAYFDAAARALSSFREHAAIIRAVSGRSLPAAPGSSPQLARKCRAVARSRAKEIREKRLTYREKSMNSLRTFISPVFCMSLLAGPMLQVGTLAAGRPDEPAANAEASRPPGVTGKTIEPDKLVVDFRLARQALEEGHSGIYRYTAKEELDGLFDSAEKSLIRPMNAVEFYRILAPVVAAIKCGHTGVGLPEEMQKAYNTKALLLPLQIRVLAGKDLYPAGPLRRRDDPCGAGDSINKRRFSREDRGDDAGDHPGRWRQSDLPNIAHEWLDTCPSTPGPVGVAESL